MGGGHTHSASIAPIAPLNRWSRIIVIALIAVCGALAIAGMLRWWPDGDRLAEIEGAIPFAAAGIEVVEGELVSVLPGCATVDSGSAVTCGDSEVRILEGKHRGLVTSIVLDQVDVGSGLSPGDRVLLLDQTNVSGSSAPTFTFYQVDRGSSLIWLTAIFVIAVVLVAWKRGVMALVSLGFAGVVVMGYLIPALLSGHSAVPVTLAASVLILIVMLYVTHGVSMRTSVALIGALFGVGLTTLAAWFAVIGSRLSGRGDEYAGLLSYNVEWISVQQLIVASVILAGLGTLNDVTITQVSALWELRSASPGMNRRELFRRSMRIGRDHVASTVYTLVFAYLGTALILLIAVQIYGGGGYSFLTSEQVAEEVARALVGGIALVVAMPVTTLIGALVVTASTRSRGETAAVSPAQEAENAHAPTTPTVQPGPLRRLPDNPWHAE